MTLTERSRRRVREAIEDLEADFGVERLVEDRWAVPPDEYERTRERFEAGTLGGAGAWVRNDAGEVLLVRREGYDAWQEPSGKHEPGEMLAETARREVREETGVDAALRSVALAQVVETVDEADPDRPAIARLVLVFGADYLGGEPRPEPGEIAAVRWFSDHPEDLLYEALERLPIPG